MVPKFFECIGSHLFSCRFHGQGYTVLTVLWNTEFHIYSFCCRFLQQGMSYTAYLAISVRFYATSPCCCVWHRLSKQYRTLLAMLHESVLVLRWWRQWQLFGQLCLPFCQHSNPTEMTDGELLSEHIEEGFRSQWLPIT